MGRLPDLVEDPARRVRLLLRPLEPEEVLLDVVVVIAPEALQARAALDEFSFLLPDLLMSPSGLRRRLPNRRGISRPSPGSRCWPLGPRPRPTSG